MIFYEPYSLPLLILLTFRIQFSSSVPDMIRTTDTVQCSTPQVVKLIYRFAMLPPLRLVSLPLISRFQNLGSIFCMPYIHKFKLNSSNLFNNIFMLYIKLIAYKEFAKESLHKFTKHLKPFRRIWELVTLILQKTVYTMMEPHGFYKIRRLSFF